MQEVNIWAKPKEALSSIAQDYLSVVQSNNGIWKNKKTTFAWLQKDNLAQHHPAVYSVEENDNDIHMKKQVNI